MIFESSGAAARKCAIAAALALIIFLPIVASAKTYDFRPYYVDINLLIGMEGTALSDLVSSGARGKIGVEATYEPNHFPAKFYASLYQTTGGGKVGGSDMDADHWGLALGVKKSLLVEAYPEIQPYAAGGLVLAGFGGDLKPMNDSRGIGAGAWASGGVVCTLNELFNLGVDARYSYIPVDVGGDLVNGEGFSLSVLFGYRWSRGF